MTGAGRLLRGVAAAFLIAAPLLGPAASSGEESHREALVAMEFAAVAGGSFEMGDFTGEGIPAEQPPHPVTVSGFFLGRREVTVAQFRIFAESTGYMTDAEKAGGVVDIDPAMGTFVRRGGISWKNPGFIQGDGNPAAWVTWNDAAAFTRWLADETGLPYRLPTEAEWEFAAREGGKNLRWSGTSESAELGEFAWYAVNSGGGPRKTGEKKANSLGLFDMSGNVWEWCLDWQAPYGRAGKMIIDPDGPPQGKYKALRGGSWRVGDDIIRTTYRNGYRQNYAHSSIGFRVALPRRQTY